MSKTKLFSIVGLTFVMMIITAFGAALAVNNSTSAAPHKGFVSFDTSKYGNARKSVSARAAFAKDQEVRQDSASIIARVDRHARSVIEEKAAGRLVVLTQSLALTNQVEDITDDVLDELGLPTDAPTITVDPTAGPSTEYGSSALYKTAKKELMRRNESAKEWEKREAEAQEKAETEKWLP